MDVLALGLFLAVLFGVIWLVKWMLRKVFAIKKEKIDWLSYNHINKLHKKIDWGIRIATMVGMIFTIYFVLYKQYPIALYLVVWGAFTIIDYSVRAFFEWKYTDNPKQWILTMSEIVILVIAAIVATIQFDLLTIG
ncbi:DUF4181 domain-containing protein [Planococcus faecalis]|uniref:DUF4181 domain-containing protein n=1 Tax=Planococcus faecalis TaxID=1598147 RepID=A0ABN4XVF8_9BACL|nr:DUF4181 domain-containing protein [Planococcus faecalis]AQU80722.1 hypothetical protein AJGP001_16135 [Planococcus faecalis]OHX55716.1 hypothetical protein BB777_00710 [Planococcus faecalis]